MSTNSIAPRRTPARVYHPELDCLRGFAFLMIFVHHSMPHVPEVYTRMGVSAGLASVLSAAGASGAFGVSLFFLLSAYLITELLMRERELTGGIALKKFYARRALRIWPLYYLFLAFAWALQWWIPGQHIGWRAGLAFAFFVGNWWVVFIGFPSSIIFHLWFISLQEQFYLVWPSLMKRLRARGIVIAALVMLAIAWLSRWYLAVHHTWESKMWANTFVQLDAIALGILLAVVLGGPLRIRRPLRVFLFLAGYACCLIAGSYFRIKADPLTVSRVMLGYPVAVLGGAAMFLAVFHPVEQNTSASETRWTAWPAAALGYLGRISYGLYVFHILGLMSSDYMVQHQDSSLGRYLLRNGVALAVTIVLATLSYYLLETPFLNIKKRFRTQ